MFKIITLLLLVSCSKNQYQKNTCFQTGEAIVQIVDVKKDIYLINVFRYTGFSTQESLGFWQLESKMEELSIFPIKCKELFNE